MSITLLFPAQFVVNNKINWRGELSLLGALGFVLSGINGRVKRKLSSVSGINRRVKRKLGKHY